MQDMENGIYIVNTGIRSPDRAARIEPLYRLNCQGSRLISVLSINLLLSKRTSLMEDPVG